MDIFDSVIKCGSLYASNVMKMDMVKPIPAKKPIPKISFHFKSVGSEQIPRETAMKLNKKTPRGFPIINPAKMPMLPGSARPVFHPALKTIAVLANAKRGRIIKETGLCNQCSNL